MKRIYKLQDGRVSFFGVLIENVRRKAFGIWVEFCCQEWEIIVCIGYGFGRIWFSFPHKFLYRNLKSVFWGKNFGEWGRELGFMIEPKFKEYSLFWYSDPNKPGHKWRSKCFISN